MGAALSFGKRFELLAEHQPALRMQYSLEVSPGIRCRLVQYAPVSALLWVRDALSQRN